MRRVAELKARSDRSSEARRPIGARHASWSRVLLKCGGDPSPGRAVGAGFGSPTKTPEQEERSPMKKVPVVKTRAAPSIGSSAWYPLRQLHRELTSIVARFGFGRAGLRILDFGAGDVPYRHLFSADADYRVADIGDAAPIRVRADGTIDHPDATVDLVTSFQVLEHVPDVRLYLDEAARILAPGGSLLLSTHGVWPYHPHPTDFWRWTQDGLRQVITQAGFEIDYQHGLDRPDSHGDVPAISRRSARPSPRRPGDRGVLQPEDRRVRCGDARSPSTTRSSGHRVGRSARRQALRGCRDSSPSAITRPRVR